MAERRAFKEELYAGLAKALYLGTGIALLIWFVDEILTAVLLFVAAMVVFLALNPIVNWLEARRIPRALGTLGLVLALFGIVAGIGALIAPQIKQQAVRVSRDFPQYVNRAQERVEAWLTDHPEVRSQIPNGEKGVGEMLPDVQPLLARVGRYSLTAIGALVLVVIMGVAAVYTLVNPRPLLHGFIRAFPVGLRDQASRAFVKGSRTVTGWIASNAIIGGVEAVVASVFLSAIGVPGALLWGFLTFFAELIPVVGAYLMAVPPILVALAVDPKLALWVLIFYLAMQQIVDAVLGPITRSSQMRLHPVSLLFAVVALGSAFGIVGAVLAAPLAGFIKAFYEEFYLRKQGDDPREAERVEDMLHRRLDAPAG